MISALILLACPRVFATVYGCSIDYPPVVEERFWAAVSRYDLYPSGDELCVLDAVSGLDLGELKSEDPNLVAAQLLADFGGLWRAMGSETLAPIANFELDHASRYWRFQERIDGRPVLNGGVILETETASGRIRSIRARFLPDFALSKAPTIPASRAVELAHTVDDARSPPRPPATPAPVLSWYFLIGAARLVWEVETTIVSGDNPPIRSFRLVDARHGNILRTATCDGSDCQRASGVHRFGWDPSADAEFYELNCARDPGFASSVETVYVGKLTEVVEPFVTESWCRVRGCALAGCSAWVGSMQATVWPVCVPRPATPPAQ